MNTEYKYIFWTGGWDSTYRIVQLSRMDITVQPIYVIDPSRGSIEYEQKAMEEIIHELYNHQETRAKILPVIQINLSDIPRNEDVSFAYAKIKESVRIGSQYEWLGWLAFKYPGIEIGIEKPSGEFSGCITAIEIFGKFKKEDDMLVVDKEASSQDINTLFGNLTFPIADITETEMLENIRGGGYEDVMKHIWFCHSPVDSEPCGMCRPCQQKMECNMEWLLPEQGQKRYKMYSKTKDVFGEKIAGLASRVIRRIIV